MVSTLTGTIPLGRDVVVRCDIDPKQPPIIELVGDGWTWLLEVRDQRVADQLANAAAQCRDALTEEGSWT